jgi:ATP-dependent RNA helicase DDX19/DBP5
MKDWAEVTPSPVTPSPTKTTLENTTNEVQVVGDRIYSAVKSFEQLGLSQELLKGIYAMGFEKPSKIQETALPMLLQNPPKNMIGQSQAGTGKTAAFCLNILSRIDFTLNNTQAICLAPARYYFQNTYPTTILLL